MPFKSKRVRPEIDHFIRVVEALRAKSPWGPTELPDIPDRELVILVEACMKAGAAVDRGTLLVLIERVLHRTHRQERFSPELFTSALSAELKAWHARPSVSYTLLTSISWRLPARTSIRRRIHDSTVLISASAGGRLARSSEYRSQRPDDKGVMQAGYSRLTVTTRGRDESEAAEGALRTLHLLLGHWNLQLNRSREFKAWPGFRVFHYLNLGPLHTLHHRANGKEAGSTWWLEPPTRPTPGTASLNTHSHEHFERWARRRYRASPIRKQIESALSAYNQALAHYDLATIHVRLWALLEQLTGRAGHAKAMERAAFVFSDSPRVLASLRLLADHRNTLVHVADRAMTGSNRYNAGLIDALRQIVEELLYFKIWMSPHISSMKELLWLMDSDLARQRRIQDLASKGIHLTDGPGCT